MNFTDKLKETAAAVLPVCAIVFTVALTVAPLPPSLLLSFAAGSFLVILGLAVFLAGAELGIMPAGSFLGSALTGTRKLPLILGAGFFLGFLVTIAEPDLLVLGRQAELVTGTIPAKAIVISVALGIGLFVALGLARTIFQIPFRVVVILGYLLVFALASRVDPVFVAVAFDSGGATTGPMTVPFIIALGIGVAGVRGDGDRTTLEDSFGYTGIASIGPILSVTVLGFLSASHRAGETKTAEAVRTLADSVHQSGDPSLLAAYAHELPKIMGTVAAALVPLLALLMLFQLFLLKLPPRQMRRIVAGFVYAWLGLVLFFLGTDTAFIPTGKALGTAIGTLSFNWILAPIGCVIGAVVVCAEPAVWVLTEQVEEVSGGNVRKPVLLAALAVGVAVSVGLSMWRVLAGFSIWFLLVPFYAAAIALTFVTPKLFTAIAFDSGGVASGPMASTFILSLTLGASQGAGGNPATDAFGLIAMIAVTPLVSIQILGRLFARSEKHALEGEH